MRYVRIDSLHSGDYKSCTANGTGFRVVCWCGGCDINCKGCHNNEYWGFNIGTELQDSDIEFMLKELELDMYEGITLIGGEPTAPQNVRGMISIAKAVKDKFGDSRTVWTYSGRTLDVLLKNSDSKELLDYTDVLVDGPFIEKDRNIALKFRGSGNQVIWEKENGQFVKSKLN